MDPATPVPVHMQDGNSTMDDIAADLYYQKIDLHRLKKMSIDRIELCGALLNLRLKTFLLNQ